MIRILTFALALAAAPAWAGGPGFTISGARAYGLPGLEDIAPYTGPACGAAGRATIHVTFSDPDGIAYAAVDMRSDEVRPAVSEQAETWLWIPGYSRPARSYQWRYEEPDATRTRHTIPIQIVVQPNARPIPTEIMTKDGKGALKIRRFALIPTVCR